MNIRKLVIVVTLMTVFGFFGFGKLTVITSYRYIADIVRQVGGENVKATALAKGNRDPHFITPKPSFIAKLRKAQLLIINGGQLEVGWLPPVIHQANNPKINPGSRGFLSFMPLVEPLDKPGDVSRAQGDVHPEGNPHIQLDPHHIPVFARAVAEKLCQLDPGNCRVYKKNLAEFMKLWQEKLTEWDYKMGRIKGKKVVQYHKLFDYLFHRYHIEVAATLEPLPGIPPTSRHVADVMEIIQLQKIKLIVQDVYHSAKTARYTAAKTGSQVVLIPHDIGAVKEVTDIFSLFDEIVRRLAE